MTGPSRVVAGTELGNAVMAADRAYRRADVAGMDEAYLRVIALSEGGLRVSLAVDHVSRLVRLGDAALALRRCEKHEHLTLLVLRAEIHSKLGDHAAVLADVTKIRALGLLTADDDARLLRVSALAVANGDGYDLARRLLADARSLFAAAGNENGVERIDQDMLLITLHEGKHPVPYEELRGEPRTAADYLFLALALKREHRYEEAADLLRVGVDAPGVDPAQMLSMLCELIVLLRIMGQDERAELLHPRLAEAAQWVPDRKVAEQMLDGISPMGRPGASRFTEIVARARRLIAETRLNDLEHQDRLSQSECRWRLEEVEEILARFRDSGLSERECVSWHLVAGELELALGNLDEAVNHLRVVCGARAALPEVKASALHLLGHAFFRLPTDEEFNDRAARCWEQAHRIEEDIAGLQTSDPVRIALVLAAATEYDERVTAAAARHRSVSTEESRAAVVVAMEAARGAMILPAIDLKLTRDLPQSHDLEGSRRWLAETARALPRDQVVWMLHPGRTQVHHAVVGRGWVRYVTVSLGDKRRVGLQEAIDAHMAYWHPDYLDLSVLTGAFDETLVEIADLLGVAEVIPKLVPPGVKRIAIVAGDELADIPFAGMVLPGTEDHIGLRYALSDLPCLSALRPLRQRARARRGDRSLLVSPPHDELTKSRGQFTRGQLDLLADSDVTADNLRVRLATHRHRWIRIDSHGNFAHVDSQRSTIGLAGENKLSAAEFQEIDLSHCAMVVLGACESGMAQRRGRDERTGFVRASMVAGAASVLAAKWVAEDTAGAFVLDRFERHVRCRPRDVALRQALLDLCRSTEDRRSPAWWACWTLYGDSGRQTRVNPIRRVLRRGLNHWRNRVSR